MGINVLALSVNFGIKNFRTATKKHAVTKHTDPKLTFFLETFPSDY